jgi:alkanesulfonate monooxygenase SsuD/methylene tetrahydromethanopterin reductase-like flavin-dependent oxidoreductase (luciferase family)
VKTDLLLDTFGATWDEVRAGALAAEEAGFDGLWVYDHLSGAAHGEPYVLECWSVLSALAPLTRRMSLGPLVLNMANRHPGVLAQMAATVQQISAGRLLLGVGAGSGPTSGYAVEDRALGRANPPDPARRGDLRRYVADVRHFWSRGEGFLAPAPPPPIVIGALGPKMALLAGEIGEGVNLFASAPDLEVLVATARGASPRPDFLVTVLTPFDGHWLVAEGPSRRRLSDLGVDRLILSVKPPYLNQIAAMPAAHQNV